MEAKPQFILKRVKRRVLQINSRVTCSSRRRSSKIPPARFQHKHKSKHFQTEMKFFNGKLMS